MSANERNEERVCQEEDCKTEMNVYCETHELNGKMQHSFQ